MLLLGVSSAAQIGVPLADPSSSALTLDAPGFHQKSPPFAIVSSESSDGLTGSIHAVTDFAYTDVVRALSDPQIWCEIMILHLNNRSCRVSGTGSEPLIELQVTRKGGQVTSSSYPLQLHWKLKETGRERLAIELTADTGPLGTSDYRILLVATPSGAAHTRISFTYGSRMSASAQFAMRTYLGTLASGKVGFTMVAPGNNDAPRLIDGMRALAERTVARYYLAINAWFEASRFPSSQQPEKRLELWFDATERYARQLHEIDRQSYLASKSDVGPARKLPMPDDAAGSAR